MKSFGLEGKSAVEISTGIKKKEISVREAFDYISSEQKEKDSKINAFITYDKNEYSENIKIIQEKIDSGFFKGALAGIPLAVKDNICVEGHKTTCGSKMLKEFIPPYSAHVIEKISEEGLYVSGKCNMDEFAMGSTNETSAFGLSRNPWNQDHSPGGSSGGCAAAVSSGMAYLALGTDTGGSIRQPASFCGITAIKPTYGSVSRYGLVAYASSFDQIGPMGIHTRDIAALLDIIQRPDKRDSTCIIREKTDHLKKLDYETDKNSNSSYPLKGIKIAVLENSFGRDVSECVKNTVRSFAKKIEELGAKCEIVSCSSMEYIVPAYYVIASAQASSNLARYDGVKYTSSFPDASGIEELYKKTRTDNFGNEVIRRLLLGSFVLSSGHFDEYYITALKVNRLIKEETSGILSEYDAILSPASVDTAPLLGESLQDPVKMYHDDIFTVTANLTGFPAITIPAGKGKNKLPVGVQLMSGSFREDLLLYISQVFQNNTDYHMERPPVFSGGAK